MRKFLLNFLPLFMVLCFSCTPENNEPVGPEPQEPVQESLEILQALMAFTADADEEQTLVFTSTTDWKISAEQTWCSFEQTEGPAGEISLTVTADAYKGSTERDARVLLSSTSGKVSKFLRLVQKPANALLLSSRRVEIPATAGSIEIPLSKAAVTAEILGEIPWLTVKGVDNKIVTLTCRANDIDAPRIAEVRFTSEGTTEILTIYQEGKTTSGLLLNKAMTMGYPSGKVLVDIKVGPAFQVEVPADCFWCHYQAADQTADFSAVFVVDENTTDEVRKTSLIFRQEVTGLVEEFELVQYYKGVVALTTSNYELTAAAQQINISLRANVEFKVEVDQPWIRPVETKAMTTHELLFDIDENEVTEVREGQIQITYIPDDRDGEAEVALVKIVQAAAKPLQYVVIKHSCKEMTVPEIIGTGMEASVLWEPGMAWVGYRTDLTHAYQGVPPYRLEIKGADMEEFFLPALTDVQAIDFSRF